MNSSVSNTDKHENQSSVANSEISKNDIKKRILYGRALCPYVRTIMLGLSEKKLPFVFEMKMSDPNDDSLPVLVDLNEQVISTTYAIMEYLEEMHRESRLMCSNPLFGAEARRLINWCQTTLANKVTNILVFERAHKFIWRLGSPKHKELVVVRKDLHECLLFVDQVLLEREYFASDILSWADLTLAAHISCLDFLGEIAWKHYSGLYMWYLKMKSRPSFITILNEEIPGLHSALHYKLLDFDQV